MIRAIGLSQRIGARGSTATTMNNATAKSVSRVIGIRTADALTRTRHYLHATRQGTFTIITQRDMSKCPLLEPQTVAPKFNV